MPKDEDYVFGEVRSEKATFAGQQRAGLIEDMVNLALRTLVNPLQRTTSPYSTDGRNVTYSFPLPRNKGPELSQLELNAMHDQLVGALKLVASGTPMNDRLTDGMVKLSVDPKRNLLDVKVNGSLLCVVQECSLRMNFPPPPAPYRN